MLPDEKGRLKKAISIKASRRYAAVTGDVPPRSAEWTS
jgi:hypothetical protein